MPDANKVPGANRVPDTSKVSDVNRMPDAKMVPDANRIPGANIGRVIYYGEEVFGILGLVDAAECVPTYGAGES